MAGFSFTSINAPKGGSGAKGGTILSPPQGWVKVPAPKNVTGGPVRLAPGVPKPTTPLPTGPAQTPLVKPPAPPGAPGQTAGTSGTSGPSPLDSTYFNNVATNTFKVNNQINGLNSNIANQGTALQAALGQLAYQQPRAQLATEEAANRRGALYSTGYDQQLGDLNQKYLTQGNSLTSNEGQKVAALNSQIQALLGGIPLYNQGQALASGLRTSAAAANNPATGQPPIKPKATVPKVSGTISDGGPWKAVSPSKKPPSKTPIRDPFAKKTGFSSTVKRVKSMAGYSSGGAGLAPGRGGGGFSSSTPQPVSKPGSKPKGAGVSTGPPPPRVAAAQKAPVKIAKSSAHPIDKGAHPGAAQGANNPLLNPGTPLTGQALLAAAQSLTNAQTSGPLAELQQQIAANNNQTRGTINLTGGLFNQLGQQAQQGVQNENLIASGLNNTLTGIANGENSQLAQLGQNAQSSLLAHAPQGEGGLSTAAQQSLASEIARQQGLAAQQEGTFRSFGANQGANYGGMSASQQGTQAMAGQEALRNIAQSGTVKNQPLVAKIADLQAQKGALLAANEGKLRQQEINNGITEQGLGIKGQQLGLDNKRLGITQQNNLANQRLKGQEIQAANNRAQAQINATNGRFDAQYQLDKQKFGAAQAKDSYERRYGLGPYRPSANTQKLPKTTPTGTPTLSPLQQQRDFGYVDEVRTLIPQMQQPLSDAAAKSLVKAGYNVKAGQKLSEGQIRHLLQTGIHPGGNTKYDPALVDSAYALAGWGYLTQKQIVELNKLGLIVGNRYRRQSAAQNVATTVGGAARGVGNAVGNF